jgi:hypothetical protein
LAIIPPPFATRQQLASTASALAVILVTWHRASTVTHFELHACTLIKLPLLVNTAVDVHIFVMKSLTLKQQKKTNRTAHAPTQTSKPNYPEETNLKNVHIFA